MNNTERYWIDAEYHATVNLVGGLLERAMRPLGTNTPGVPLACDRRNGHTELWFCEPPAKNSGICYTVTREEWNADVTERRIYEIKIAGAFRGDYAFPS